MLGELFRPFFSMTVLIPLPVLSDFETKVVVKMIYFLSPRSISLAVRQNRKTKGRPLDTFRNFSPFSLFTSSLWLTILNCLPGCSNSATKILENIVGARESHSPKFLAARSDCKSEAIVSPVACPVRLSQRRSGLGLFVFHRARRKIWKLKSEDEGFEGKISGSEYRSADGWEIKREHRDRVQN